MPVLVGIFTVVGAITASFGVVSWIFADGHLEGLLGLESQGFLALDGTQPILMLAILFGVSMDDAVTVVRALLVPPTMKLLGAANWWAPGPLRRWWERHGHREPPAARPLAEDTAPGL